MFEQNEPWRSVVIACSRVAALACYLQVLLTMERLFNAPTPKHDIYPSMKFSTNADKDNPVASCNA